MNEPKFTKGPWKVSDVCGLAMFDNPKDYYQYIQTNDDVIGLVWGRVGDREANAQLISCSPDFYQNATDEIVHLQTLKNQICCLLRPKKDTVVTLDFVLKYIDEIIGDTENLLAKARGEVQE